MTDDSHDYGTSDNPKLVEAEGRGDNVRSTFGRPSPEPELVDGEYLPPEGTTEVTSHWDEEGASPRPMVDQRAAPRITRRVGDQRQIAASNPRYDIPLVEPTGDFRPIRSRNANKRARKNGQAGATTADRRNMAKGLASLFNGAQTEAAAAAATATETSDLPPDAGLMTRPPETESRLSARVQPDESTARVAAAPTPETTPRETPPLKAPPRTDPTRALPPPPRENAYETKEPDAVTFESAAGAQTEAPDKLEIEVYHDELGSLERQLREALAEVEFWRRGTLLAFFMAVGAALVVFWPF